VNIVSRFGLYPISGLVCLLFAVPGCATTHAEHEAADPHRIISAHVDRYHAETSNHSDDHLDVTDPEELAKLISFFPELGQEKVASSSGEWVAQIAIAFKRADGSHIKVATDGRWWSEGHGDWRANRGLGGYMDQLVALHERVAP